MKNSTFIAILLVDGIFGKIFPGGIIYEIK